MRAPFTYFGGKYRASPLIWQALGNPDNYVEPFCGSAAALLARPRLNPWPPRGETINDADGYIVNVWRAIKTNPSEVTSQVEALGPSQELTLHAVNRELIDKRGSITEKLRESVDWCDIALASRWLWGICQWIGSGWGAAQSEKLQRLGSFGVGIFSLGVRERVTHVLNGLSERLRHVRITCGDWSRVVTPVALTNHRQGATQGILLDPPYSHDLRDSSLYAREMGCAQDVALWAFERGEDELIRVVLCGLEDEHKPPPGWRIVRYKLAGMSNTGSRQGKIDCLYLSPYCFPVDGEEMLETGAEYRAPRRQLTLWR